MCVYCTCNTMQCSKSNAALTQLMLMMECDMLVAVWCCSSITCTCVYWEPGFFQYTDVQCRCTCTCTCSYVWLTHLVCVYKIVLHVCVLSTVRELCMLVSPPPPSPPPPPPVPPPPPPPPPPLLSGWWDGPPEGSCYYISEPGPLCLCPSLRARAAPQDEAGLKEDQEGHVGGQHIISVHQGGKSHVSQMHIYMSSTCTCT